MATVERSIGTFVNTDACVRAIENEDAPQYTARMDLVPLHEVFAGDKLTDSAGNSYDVLKIIDDTFITVEDNAVHGVPPVEGTVTLARGYATFALAHAGIAADAADVDDLIWNVFADEIFDEHIVISDTTLTTGSLKIVAKDRHVGVEGSGVLIAPSTDGAALRIASSVTYNVTIDGLEFAAWLDPTQAVAIKDEAASGTLILDKLIVRNNGQAATTAEVVGIECSPTVGRAVIIRNCLIRNLHNNDAAAKAVGIRLQVAGQSIHNCTVRDVKNDGAGANGAGVEVLAAVVAPGVEIRGVVCSGCDVDFSVLGGAGDIAAASDVNASVDGTAPGGNPITGIDPLAVFISPTNSKVPPNASLIDVANNITAQFGADLADAVRSLSELWDVGAYDGALTDPSGVLSETEENLATLLADSAGFRSWVEATTRAQARVRIHFDELTPPTGDGYLPADLALLRPYALIWIESLRLNKRGAPNTFTSNGLLWIRFVENVTDFAQLDRLDPQDVGRRFKNHVGAVLADFVDTSHVAGHYQFEVAEYRPTRRAHEDEVPAQGEFIMCEVSLEFGPGAAA